MSDKISVANLARLVQRQGQTLGYISLHIADHARLLYALMEKCSACNVRLSTVVHLGSDLKCCDHCAASIIVRSTNTYMNSSKKNVDDQFSDITLSMSLERNWVDVPDAESIRRVDDYLQIVREDDILPKQVN